MLARQDLRWCHQRGLTAGFDCEQHRHQRDQSLAAADIALQQAQHATGRFVCRRKFRQARNAASLVSWKAQRTVCALITQACPIAIGGDAPTLALENCVAHLHQRQLVRQHLRHKPAVAARVSAVDIQIIVALRRCARCASASCQDGQLLAFQQSAGSIHSGRPGSFGRGIARNGFFQYGGG